MFGDAPLTDVRPLPFQPMFFAMPAFGVMVQHGAYGSVIAVSGQDLYRTGQPNGPSSDRTFYVNGPSDVDSLAVGTCTMAIGQPVYALYKTGGPTGSPLPSQVWGPLGTGDYKLYPGIPGFRIVGQPDTANGRVLVVRDTRVMGFAKAITKWSNTAGFTAHPVTDDSATGIYDGLSHGGGPALPSITLTFDLGYVGKVNGRDWNIQIDDIFGYELGDDLAGGAHLIPHARHLDDQVGTIKAWSLGPGVPSTIPKGWALCDGTANASPGSGVDMRGYFPVGVETRSGGSVPSYSDFLYALGGSGGVKLLSTTTVTTSFPGNANVVNQTDNRPPWKPMTFIERIA